MALTQNPRNNRRRLEPADLRFNRTVGSVVVLIGAIFVWSLVFSSFDVKVRFQWSVTPDGGRVPITHITCPSPWSVLINGAEPEVTTADGFCVMPSRSLAIEGAIVTGATLLIGAFFFSRTTRPGPLPDLPLRPTARRGGMP
jgi:hypothetical protein